MADPVEVMARGFDPEIWSIDSPGLTRGETEDFHSRRQISVGLARTALSALDAAGFAVVPKEPTQAMLGACWPLHHPWGANAPAPEERPGLFAEMKDGKRLDWSAMLKAARFQP